MNEVVIFWEKAGIPTRARHRCNDKLNDLYLEWRNVQKSNKQNFDNSINEENFCAKFELLFDISHGNALEMISEEKKIFLLNQKSGNMDGFIPGFLPDEVLSGIVYILNNSHSIKQIYS